MAWPINFAMSSYSAYPASVYRMSDVTVIILPIPRPILMFSNKRKTFPGVPCASASPHAGWLLQVGAAPGAGNLQTAMQHAAAALRPAETAIAWPALAKVQCMLLTEMRVAAASRGMLQQARSSTRQSAVAQAPSGAN